MDTCLLSCRFGTNNQWVEVAWRHLVLLHLHFLALAFRLLIVCQKPEKSSDFPAPHPTKQQESGGMATCPLSC
jgi:hypothetical protein